MSKKAIIWSVVGAIVVIGVSTGVTGVIMQSGQDAGSANASTRSSVPVDSPEPTPSVTPTSDRMPSSPTEVPQETSAAPSSVSMVNLSDLRINLGTEWDILVADEDPLYGARYIVIPWGCAPRDPMSCGSFVVADLNSPNLATPYGDGSDSCISDGVHDNLGWSAPVERGTITVDGVEGTHFTQEQSCRWSDGQTVQEESSDTMHSWFFSERVVVYDLNLENREPDPAVLRALQNAVWSS